MRLLRLFVCLSVFEDLDAETEERGVIDVEDKTSK